MTSRSVPLTSGWAWALFATAGFALLAASPPFVGSAGDVVHGAFAWVCHQLPSRTAHVHGTPLALCHRCMGVASGLALGVALAPLVPAAVGQWTDRTGPGRVLVAALVPLGVDWTLGAFGLWANTPWSRTLTGLLAGLAAGWVLALALQPRSLSSSPSPNLLA